MNYQELSPEQFKRCFGVYQQTFAQMVEAVQQVVPQGQGQKKRGPKPKLELEEQIDLL